MAGALELDDQSGAPWPPGSATGVGSMPGANPDEAMRVVVGEFPDFPHQAELPGAGVGADMIGRGAAHLVGLHVELAVSGWRFTDRAGSDERRARAALARELDVLEEHTQGFSGPLKIQCAGPWTLAASLELRYGDKALADPGAVRDLAASLSEGVAALAVDVGRRVPGARVVVQLDEPSLPAALAGRVATASGFDMLPAVERIDAMEKLKAVADAISAVGAAPIAHCCAADVPIGVLVDAGMRAVGLDASLVTARDDDALGAALEKGVALFLGLLPPLPPPQGRLAPVRELAAPAISLWKRLGFAPETLARDVVVTPACGLAGAPASWPARVYRACAEVAKALAEEPDSLMTKENS